MSRPSNTMPWLGEEHSWISTGALAVLEYGDSLPGVYRQLHACEIQIYPRRCHACGRGMFQEITGFDYVCVDQNCKERQSHDGIWRTFRYTIHNVRLVTHETKEEGEK